jgi:hypothetical protein
MATISAIEKKPILPRSFTPEQRKAVFEFICEGIEDGLSQNEAIKRRKSIIDEHGNELLMPTRRSFIRWQAEDIELYNRATVAWDAFIIAKMDEIEELSKYGPEIDPEDTRDDIRNKHNIARLRIDTLKFQIARVGALMSKRFKPEVVIEKNKDGGMQIVVQNFSTDS